VGPVLRDGESNLREATREKSIKEKEGIDCKSVPKRG